MRAALGGFDAAVAGLANPTHPLHSAKRTLCRKATGVGYCPVRFARSIPTGPSSGASHETSSLESIDDTLARMDNNEPEKLDAKSITEFG
jgi:hypothetical protein